MLQIELSRRLTGHSHLLRPGLPAGIRQSDCDGRPDPLADASPEELWRICDERQQLIIAGHFSVVRADDVRDVLLDAEVLPADGPQMSSSLLSIGKSVWRLWISHRNTAAEDLYRRGELRVR